MTGDEQDDPVDHSRNAGEIDRDDFVVAFAVTSDTVTEMPHGAVLGGQPDHEQHARAREFLQQCRERTRDSAERLRRHLTYANEFGDLLDARTHPAPGRARKSPTDRGRRYRGGREAAPWRPQPPPSPP